MSCWLAASGDMVCVRGLVAVVDRTVLATHCIAPSVVLLLRLAKAYGTAAVLAT